MAYLGRLATLTKNTFRMEGEREQLLMSQLLFSALKWFSPLISISEERVHLFGVFSENPLAFLLSQHSFVLEPWVLFSDFTFTPPRSDISHCGSAAFIANIYTTCIWVLLYLQYRNLAEDDLCLKDVMK